MPPQGKNKRRSLVPRNDDLNATPVLDMEVDEESERKNRMKKLQKRQSIAAAGTPQVADGKGGQSQIGSISGYSATQLAELYSNCMKLSAENKINIKNAFHLQLIDYMAEMMKTKKNSDMDNFQAASCALDASAKIYAYRVDSVHSDTLKLAGGVGKTAEESKENKNDNDDDVANDDPDDMETEKKKVKRKKKAATIEKNLNNIDIAKFDLEFDVDPLFKKTSTQFDSGGGGGQFLCNLYIRDEGCQMLLDSEAFLNQESLKVQEDSEEPIEELTKLELNPEAEICPSFSSFTFRNWSIENEDPAFLNLSIRSEHADESLKELDADHNEDHHAFDVNAPPAEDFDDDDHGGGFFDHHDDDDEGGDEGANGAPKEPKAGLGMQLVANLKQKLTAVPNEYSYFDNGRMGAWAGPKHWKFKPISKPQPGQPSGGLASKNERKKSTKEPVGPYDFEEMYSESGELWQSVEKTMTVPKKAIKLQNKTMVNWSEDKLILPTDLHYKGKDFAKLFITPELLVTNKGTIVPESVDDSVAEYDFDNANDADDYCPALPENTQSGNYDDDNLAGETGYFPSQTMLPSQSQGDLLVSAPNKVEKIQIGYAKQAKKMDMRKLKAIEWSLLQTTVCEADKENDKETINEASAKVNDALNGEIAFGQLYKNLSESRLMPKMMGENLSVPLAFVALLHLCNERTLALESLPDFADFNITQG